MNIVTVSTVWGFLALILLVWVICDIATYTPPSPPDEEDNP